MKTPPKELLDKLRQLRLDAFVDAVEELYRKDPQKAAMLLPEIEKMADTEIAERTDRTVKRRIKEAQFVRIQTIDTFNFDYNAATKKIRKRYLRLFEAGPVEQAVGATFVGSAGLGKTHLARALGYAACQHGHRVLFAPCTSMLNRLVAADATKTLDREVKRFESPALLIIDELAYITMSQMEANLFFQIVARRHDHRRPTVVTTNKPFTEWNQVFHGDATAHVIIDRLTDRAELFFLEGRSYRQTHRKGLS